MEQPATNNELNLFIDILTDMICQYLEAEETAALLESCQPDVQQAPEAA